MKVLVAAASKHGATAGIAAEIGKWLATSLVEAEVDVLDAGQVRDVSGYDAAVVGSGVYAGHWLAPAKALVDQCAARPGLPVWLFSSGPLGEPLKPAESPADVAALVTKVGAREHVVLPGKADKRQLSVAERAVVRMVRAPYGDFRDWGKVRDFAQSVAAELRGRQA